MAINKSRGLPWAGGRVAVQPRSAERNSIRVYSARGLSAPGTLGTVPLPQIGTPIPGTALVYVRPRLTQDELGGTGGSPFFGYRYPGANGLGGGRVGVAPPTTAVRYTNPEFSFYRENRRTPSIGMARGGQTGLTMRVPYEAETPYFSVA